MNELSENKVYQSLRTVVAAVAGISLINVFLIKMEIERNLLFSAFLPVWGANYGIYFAPEVNRNRIIAGGVLLIGVLYMCYLLAGKRPGWMMFAALLYLIDTWIMIWFIETRGYSYTSWGLDIVSHIIVLVLMVRAGVIGRNRIKKKPAEVISEPVEEKPENKVDYYVDD